MKIRKNQNLKQTIKTCGYPKTEKLKKKKHIDLLFSEGKSVSKYPLRLVFAPVSDAESSFQTGVSVSKRYFKKAVDRNRFKRLLREAYRLNKTLLPTDLNQPYALMFLYQTKDKLTFAEIQKKMVQLMEKFSEKVKSV